MHGLSNKLIFILITLFFVLNGCSRNEKPEANNLKFLISESVAAAGLGLDTYFSELSNYQNLMGKSDKTDSVIKKLKIVFNKQSRIDAFIFEKLNDKGYNNFDEKHFYKRLSIYIDDLNSLFVNSVSKKQFMTYQESLEFLEMKSEFSSFNELQIFLLKKQLSATLIALKSIRIIYGKGYIDYYDHLPTDPDHADL